MERVLRSKIPLRETCFQGTFDGSGWTFSSFGTVIPKSAVRRLQWSHLNSFKMTPALQFKVFELGGYLDARLCAACSADVSTAGRHSGSVTGSSGETRTLQRTSAGWAALSSCLVFYDFWTQMLSKSFSLRKWHLQKTCSLMPSKIIGIKSQC